MVKVVASCRTIPRFNEIVYAGLVAMVLGVGIALILLGVFSGFAGISIVGFIAGLVLLAAGIHQYRIILMRTASQLSLDVAEGRLGWRATAAHGELSIRDIVSIARATRPRRPTVYQFHCGDETKVSFWLATKDPAVRSFFEQLRKANPSIGMTELYERRRMWWTGLSRS
jgi:hypothetical protein